MAVSQQVAPAQFRDFQAKVPSSRIEKVESKLFPGKEVYFVRGVNHSEIRDKSFPGMTLGPREVQKLFNENPNNVRSLLFEAGAYMGLAVATQKPLAEHISQYGLFSLTVNYGNETRILTIKPGNFEKAKIDKAQLLQNGKLLTISEHYTAPVDGNTYSFRVFDATPDSMQLSDRPMGDGWTNIFGGDVHYDEYKSESGDVLGSVRRGRYWFGNYVGRNLLVGDRSGLRRGVFRLIDATGAQAPAALQNGKPELITLAEGATAAVDKAVQQFGAVASEVLQPVRDLIAKVQNQ